MFNNAEIIFRSLGDLVEILSGYTKRKLDREGDDYFLLQVSDIEGDLILNEDKVGKSTQANPSEQYLLRNGDLVFTSKGEKNYAYQIPSLQKSILASNTFLILRNFQDIVLPEYVLWYINSKKGQDFLNDVRRGNTIPYIPISVLREMPVLLPCVEDQKQLTKVAGLKDKEEILRNKLTVLRKKLVEAEILDHLNKTSTR